MMSNFGQRPQFKLIIQLFYEGKTELDYLQKFISQQHKNAVVKLNKIKNNQNPRILAQEAVNQCDDLKMDHSEVWVAFDDDGRDAEVKEAIDLINKSGKDIVFVGGILWTDFKLFGEAHQVFSMNSAQTGINDFNYNYVNNGNLSMEKERNFSKLQGLNIVRKLHPKDCISMFDTTLRAIKSACEQFPDKKIVVVTHHAPSEQSVAPMYKADKTTPAFASNLERFILNHPNIVLWCHGHIHSRSDYFIDKCRVICNPRGYEKYEDTDFESNFIIDI